MIRKTCTTTYSDTDDFDIENFITTGNLGDKLIRIGSNQANNASYIIDNDPDSGEKVLIFVNEDFDGGRKSKKSKKTKKNKKSKKSKKSKTQVKKNTKMKRTKKY